MSRRFAFVLGAWVLLSGIGIAWAALSSSGAGSSTVLTGNMSAVTVAAVSGGDAPATQLQPGGTAEVILRVRNPNSYPVVLHSITGNGTIVATGGIGSCDTPNVTFVDQPSVALPIPGNSTTLVRLASAVSMASTAPTGCQGALFSIPVAITSGTS